MVALSAKSLLSHAQYLLLAFFFLVDLYLIPSPPFPIRLLVAPLIPLACYTPYVKRFFVPFLPILTWLLTFYACKFVPISIRPPYIFVSLLPTLERILYGANLSELLSRSPNAVLDVLAWLPYGVIHFCLPFVFSASLFWFAPPGTLPVFGRAFGYMNLAGVLTQMAFPTAPPCEFCNSIDYVYFP
ncbi:hypothetical protein BC936DRAFT_137616 [Jimgerdemannia flammicorona]|uniref:Inositolphosphotransferase Aur1/Ipt1 domain-containing protein n=1 Tax=Jimgerdemannia flammicorona TaxID=994334 RepID=A0A433DIZ5_9FUNG|nr:hypothetical protein BC936DRAFT_137616 [Jimgerdemannia flammicorona]